MMRTVFKQLLWIFLVVFAAAALLSCDNDDDDAKEPQTMLEQHRSNLNYVNVSGDQMAYLDYGNQGGKTIILMHGIPTSSFLYRNIAEELAENTGFRVIAVDMLGFGESDKPARKEAYTFDSQAQRLFDFATAVGVNEFVLGLHDSGAFIGWTALLHSSSNRITGMLIADTNLNYPGFTPPAAMLPIFTGEKTPEEVWGPADEDDAVADDLIDNFIGGGIFNKSLLTDELLEAYSTPLKQSSDTYVGIFETIGFVIAQEEAVKEAFANFGKPVAIVWGAEDAFLPESIAQGFKTDLNVPDNRFTLIGGAGHFLQEDKPAEYIQAVSTFLNEDF